jgi:hypothetical protein
MPDYKLKPGCLLEAAVSTPCLLTKDFFCFVSNNQPMTSDITINDGIAVSNCAFSSDNGNIYITPTAVNFSFKLGYGSLTVINATAKTSLQLPISILTVKNTLGESVNDLVGLSTSSKINPLSYFKPDKVSPHGIYEFKGYCHDTKQYDNQIVGVYFQDKTYGNELEVISNEVFYITFVPSIAGATLSVIDTNFNLVSSSGNTYRFQQTYQTNGFITVRMTDSYNNTYDRTFTFTLINIEIYDTAYTATTCPSMLDLSSTPGGTGHVYSNKLDWEISGTWQVLDNLGAVVNSGVVSNGGAGGQMTDTGILALIDSIWLTMVSGESLEIDAVVSTSSYHGGTWGFEYVYNQSKE